MNLCEQNDHDSCLFHMIYFYFTQNTEESGTVEIETNGETGASHRKNPMTP